MLPALTEAYLEMRAQDRIASKREWKDQVEEWRFKHPFRYRRVGPLKTQYVMERFRDLLADRDVIWTTGVGQHQMWAAQWLKIEKPRHWITSGGLGTMGFGVPAAIGAQMAFPDKTVVNIDGDGCFQMTMQELATARLLRRARRSTRSSTTAGSAWCASGSSCSTASATPRRCCATTCPTT